MPAEYGFVGDSREETLRTEKVQRTELESVTIPLSVGGSVTLQILEDVEEYVGSIAPNNHFNVSDRGGYFRVRVYRKKKVCTVGDCATTAEQKFDGNWLCPQHLDSYTARNF